jgi:hypothetical protein
MANVASYTFLKNALVLMTPERQVSALWFYMRGARFDPRSVYAVNARRLFFLLITHAKTEMLRTRALSEYARICEIHYGPHSPAQTSLKRAEARDAATPA